MIALRLVLALASFDVGQEARLTAPDAGHADQFAAVSLSGDTLVVGATNHGGNGAAYVFVRTGTGWTLQQKLVADDGEYSDGFGWATAVAGDTAIVGAFAAGTDGAAYIFVRSGTTWALQQKITTTDDVTNFGVAVSLTGNVALVGTASEAAYVFVRSGTVWTLQQKLTPSAGESGDFFGWSVSLSGDTAVVGARSGNAAYVFVRTGSAWTEQQKIVPFDPGAYAGVSVSVSGDTIALGGYPPAGGAPSAVYVFTRSGTVWTEQQRLTAPDGEPLDVFGYSVSLDGNVLVAGAPRDDTGASQDVGSAYLFTRSGTVWGPPQKLTALDGAPEDVFGEYVALSGHTVAVGAIWADIAGATNAGAAYVFRAPARSFFAVAPCRAADTRVSGGALAAGGTRTFAVAGLCQVPNDARAVVANLVAVNPGDAGHLRAHATGAAMPLTSVLNFAAGHTRANQAILALGTDGQIDVRCELSPGSSASTHFVLDVSGYFK